MSIEIFLDPFQINMLSRKPIAVILDSKDLSKIDELDIIDAQQHVPQNATNFEVHIRKSTLRKIAHVWRSPSVEKLKTSLDCAVCIRYYCLVRTRWQPSSYCRSIEPCVCIKCKHKCILQSRFIAIPKSLVYAIGKRTNRYIIVIDPTHAILITTSKRRRKEEPIRIYITDIEIRTRLKTENTAISPYKIALNLKPRAEDYNYNELSILCALTSPTYPIWNDVIEVLGDRGVGKTFATLCYFLDDPNVAVVTTNPVDGKIKLLDPSVINGAKVNTIDEVTKAEIVVLNDIHYAIELGRIDVVYDILSKVLKHANQVIVVSDEPLSYYVKLLRWHSLAKLLADIDSKRLWIDPDASPKKIVDFTTLLGKEISKDVATLISFVCSRKWRCVINILRVGDITIDKIREGISKLESWYASLNPKIMDIVNTMKSNSANKLEIDAVFNIIDCIDYKHGSVDALRVSKMFEKSRRPKLSPLTIARNFLAIILSATFSKTPSEIPKYLKELFNIEL